MYLKILVLVLMLSFVLKGYDAKLVGNLEEKNQDDTLKYEETPEIEGENTKVETKRSLRGYRKTKSSIGDLSLELAKLHILEETLKKGKAIDSLKNEVNENSEDNCRKIKKVGEPIVHHHSGTNQGTWMRDPLGLLGAEKIWYINGYYGNKVLEFEDMDHFKAGEIGKTYNLPYSIDGTGSVVYGRYLYFNRAGTCNIVQYDLVTEKVTRQSCPNGNIKSRRADYQWGGYTTVDLSVDESGLWVLWAYSGYSKRLCATQLDPLTLSALNHYYGISSEAKTSMGNAFVACGIVYSIDSYNGRPTTINYAYDTATGSRTNPSIRFNNKFQYNSMVTYNPREKVLYAWDNKRQVTYPLEFED